MIVLPRLRHQTCPIMSRMIHSCLCLKTHLMNLLSASSGCGPADFRFYAVAAHFCVMVSRSMRASSLTSSRIEYRLGVLLWLNSLSSRESLACWLALSWACWLASSARRTTSWTSWLRPCGWCCCGSELRCGLLLMTSSFRRSAWKGVDWTEIRTYRGMMVILVC